MNVTFPDRHHDDGGGAHAPRPVAALDRLDPFVGEWIAEGQQHEGVAGPATGVRAFETFEWLPGGRFLVYRFVGTVGDRDVACIEITGRDPGGDGFRSHSFCGDGTNNEWRWHDRGPAWVLTGVSSVAGRPLRVRRTIEFGDSSTTMSCRWEHSIDGAIWHTFWEIVSTRAG